MSPELAVFLTTRFLGLVLSMQAIEMLWLSRAGAISKIWTYENLRDEIQKAFPFLEGMMKILFSKKGFEAVVILQFLIGMMTLLLGQGFFFIGLFCTHLLINLRFFGSFNGGSDSMVFVLVTGVLISTLVPSPELEKLGLIYITIHALISYFKAGLVKVTQPEWRNGTALSTFLSQSVYDNGPILARLKNHYSLMPLILAWTVLLFELGMPTVLFSGNYAWIYFGMAILFHFSIYLTLGLNRFFWAWMCSWPAILCTASLIQK